MHAAIGCRHRRRGDRPLSRPLRLAGRRHRRRDGLPFVFDLGAYAPRARRAMTRTWTGQCAGDVCFQGGADIANWCRRVRF